MALGASYPETDGKKDCALYVDIPAHSGPGSGVKIHAQADGLNKPMLIYTDGKFTPTFLDYKNEGEHHLNWRKLRFSFEG